MEAENQSVKSQFLLRLSNLPIVHSALDRATSAYGVVKNSNFLFDYTLSTVEKSVLYANGKAQPLVTRFEAEIASADGLACKGLDKLEQTVPIIKEPTEKILQDTKTACTNAVQSGVDRYNTLRTYGTEKVSAVKKYGTDKATELLTSQYGKLVIGTVDDALTLAENYLDTYLPASDDDDSNAPAKNKPAFERISYLCSVVHRRSLKLAAAKLQELQDSARTSIDNLHIHDRLDQLTAVPENLYCNAIWVWSELNKTQTVPEGTRQTVSQQAWYIAQQATQTAVATYNTSVTSVQGIPSAFQSGIYSAYSYAVNTYSTVVKFSQELPQQFVDQAREKLELLNHLPAYQWLVTAYESSRPAFPETHDVDE